MSSNLPAYVLDSFALLAHLEGEAGGPEVSKILTAATDAQVRIFLSLINFGEVVYITEREQGLPEAQRVIAAIDQLPVVAIAADRTRVLAAAHIKAHYALSYADAFAVALAHEMQATLVTGDPEFKQVADLVTIHWLPQIKR